MIEKIYKIYGGKLVEIPVTKETEKMVFVDAPKELAYSTRLYKNHVCTTPAEAIQEEKNIAIELVGMYSVRLEDARKRLQNVRDVEVNYYGGTVPDLD